MPIKAILFDKDGTLIDFEATFGPATALVIRDLADGDTGIEEALADVSGFDRQTLAIAKDSLLIAGSLENIVQAWLPNLTDTELDEALKRVDQLYENHSLKTLAPFPYLHAVLDHLDEARIPYGIATNDSETAARAHMKALGILDRFRAIIGFDSGYGEKPGPGMVSAFVERIGVAPEDVMMVGDSTHDLIAGRAAGCMTVAVTTGLADTEALSPHADHVVPDISHLPALIFKFNEQVHA